MHITYLYALRFIAHQTIIFANSNKITTDMFPNFNQYTMLNNTESITTSNTMTRKEILTSKEYWVQLISIQLWDIHGCKERLSDKFDKMAEQIVDDNFIKKIHELSEMPQNEK